MATQSDNKIPEGLVNVHEFAKTKGMPVGTVIQMIRDGSYVGQIVDDEWYIDRGELSGNTSKKAGAPSTSTNQLAQMTDARNVDYRTAQIVAQVISGMGWAFVIAGIGTPIAFLISNTGFAPPGGLFGMILGGVIVTAFGLLIVAAGQITRAVVDTANNTNEIAYLLKTRG